MDAYAASLTRTLKDHDNRSHQDFLNRRFRRCNPNDDEEDVNDESCLEHMTRLYLSKLMDSGKAAELRASVVALKAFITIQLIDESSEFFDFWHFQKLLICCRAVFHGLLFFCFQKTPTTSAGTCDQQTSFTKLLMWSGDS